MARKAFEAYAGPMDAVVSTGWCGALDPALRVGDIVVATAVNEFETVTPVTNRNFTLGKVVSIDRVAGTIEEKSRLLASGAIAVEMEAAALAEAAAGRNLPFYCVRAVSDTARDEFALDFNAVRGEDGQFRMTGILGQALCRPMAIVPELFRLQRNTEIASKALGEFFADCSF
jgi:adenosylhomocysteine nucleosidase